MGSLNLVNLVPLMERTSGSAQVKIGLMMGRWRRGTLISRAADFMSLLEAKARKAIVRRAFTGPS
jgi:hypothetical protein